MDTVTFDGVTFNGMSAQTLSKKKVSLKLKVTCQAIPEDDNCRAVDVLCRRTGMSRLMAKRIRIHGRLTCNGQFHRMIDRVKTGDVLEAGLPSENEKPVSIRHIPEAPFLYRDQWLVVVAKPTGMVIHPTYLHHEGSLTDRLSDLPLHPVIRLDRDTSGAVLIALNGHAHYVLTQNKMEKFYIGMVHGKMRSHTGLIQAPVGRVEGSIMLRQVSTDGSPAYTAWQVIRYYHETDVSLVRFKLLTGRTHQIRVHCQSIGHPLVGDGLYGWLETPQATGLDRLIGRQALHASELFFTHPETFTAIRVTAPFPEDFRQLLKRAAKRE